MTMLGHENTLSAHRGRDAASRQGRTARDNNALLIADMPYGSFHVSVKMQFAMPPAS